MNFVIIVNYKMSDLIFNLITKSSAGEASVKFVIFDNSNDIDKKLFLNNYLDVFFLDAGKNIGYGSAINKCKKYIKNNFQDEFGTVTVLNPDVILPDYFFKTFFEKVSPKANEIWGGVTYDITNCELECYGGKSLNWILAKPRKATYGQDIDYISGAFMHMSLDLFYFLDNFDDRYFLYWEDFDYCVSAKNKIDQLIFCVFDDVPIFHKKSYSATASYKGLYKKIFYIHRNRIIFYWKNARCLIFVAVLRSSLAIIYNVAKAAFKFRACVFFKTFFSEAMKR